MTSLSRGRGNYWHQILHCHIPLLSCISGATTAYTFDAGNRLSQIADSEQYDVSFDTLTQEVAPLRAHTGTVNYQYDAAGRRSQMQTVGQTAVTWRLRERTAYLCVRHQETRPWPIRIAGPLSSARLQMISLDDIIQREH